MSDASAFYKTSVMHARLRPKKHKLKYDVFYLLLDLDELPALAKSLKLFSFNSPGLVAFDEKDHGEGKRGHLRAWVDAQLHSAGVQLAKPHIRVLCFPRLFGYVFNPLTIYFCHDGERLAAILYEVCNTFHEKRTYVVPIGEQTSPLRHDYDKKLYVSPFMPMDCRYAFTVEPPGEKVMVRIDESDKDGTLLVASLAGTRQPLTDTVLGKALLAYPLMTLKVIGAIHWEAIKLIAKRVPFFGHKKAERKVTTSVVGKR